METNESSVEAVSEEHWSDWEEMLDPPMPDFVGVLEVKPTEMESISRSNSIEEDKAQNKPEALSTLSNSLVTQIAIKGKMKSFHSLEDEIPSSAIVKSSAMQLKDKSKSTKMSKKHGLGEEYDIMSIKVEKKHDSELDLFADLAPTLPTKDYNLETMLLEASNKTRRKLPSLSDTLAKLDIGGVEEGEDWNEESWIPPEDLFLSISQKFVGDSSGQAASLVNGISSKEIFLTTNDWDKGKWENF